MFDQLVKGNLHMMLTWPQTSYDERIGVNYMPYLVLNWDDAIKAYGKDGWLSKVITPVFKDLGLKYFGPYPEGFVGVATKDRYATGFEDAKSLKVRTQPVFPVPQTIRAMGFQAVPIDWSEVYTSIQTGVVDGDSSNVIYWDYEYFRDLVDYYVHSKHLFSSYSLLMNDDAFSELDEEDRAIISDAAEAVINKQFIDAKTEDDKWIRIAQEAGMTYIEPDKKQMKAWIEKVRNDVWPMAEATLGKDVLDTIRRNASAPE